jgi:hypothetical protein
VATGDNFKKMENRGRTRIFIPPFEYLLLKEHVMEETDSIAIKIATMELKFGGAPDVDTEMAVISEAEQHGGALALATAASRLCKSPAGTKWESKTWENHIADKLGLLPGIGVSGSTEDARQNAIRDELLQCKDLRNFFLLLLPAFYRLGVPVNHEDLSSLIKAQSENAPRMQDDGNGKSKRKGFKPKQRTTTEIAFSRSQKFLDPKKLRNAGYVDEPNAEPWGTAFRVLVGLESKELSERIELCKKLNIGAREFMTKRYSLAYLNCLDLLKTGGCDKIIEVFKPAMTVTETFEFEQEELWFKTHSLVIHRALEKKSSETDEGQDWNN